MIYGVIGYGQLSEPKQLLLNRLQGKQTESKSDHEITETISEKDIQNEKENIRNEKNHTILTSISTRKKKKEHEHDGKHLSDDFIPLASGRVISRTTKTKDHDGKHLSDDFLPRDSGREESRNSKTTLEYDDDFSDGVDYNEFSDAEEDLTASPPNTTPPDLISVKGLLSIAEKEAKSPSVTDFFLGNLKEANSPSMEEYFSQEILNFQQKVDEVFSENDEDLASTGFKPSAGELSETDEQFS